MKRELYDTFTQNVARAELGEAVYKTKEEFMDRSLTQRPATSSNIDDLVAQTKARAIDSLYYFTTAILGWNKLKPTPHMEMCDFLQDRVNSRKVLLVPRDCYKSTVASKSYPLWIVIQPEYFGLKGTEHRIHIRMHSGDNSKKQLMSIRQQVERNEIFRMHFPEVIPDFGAQGSKWTDTALLFPREGLFGEATIECSGLETHVVSRHYTIQIKDDLEDLASYESPTVRERVKTVYKADESLFVDEQTGVDRIIGTRWGINDLYNDIFTTESETYKRHVRPIEWTRQELIDDLEEARKNDRPPTWDMDPDTYAPEDGKKYFFFPSLFPEASCKRIAQKQGPFMFSMLYKNNPRDPSMLEFKPEWLQECWLDMDGFICYEHRQGHTVRIPLEATHRVLMWDPALSERKVKQKCDNAMIVLAQDKHYNRFLLDAHAKPGDPTLQLDKFIGLHQRWLVQKAGIEDAGFQRILKHPLYHRMREMEYQFPVKEQPPIGEKDFRIRGLIPMAELGQFYIRRGIAQIQEVRAQFEGFPNYPKKDIPDCTAAAVELFGSGNEAKDEHTARREALAQQKQLASRNRVTGY
jgi:hypothetical protein